MSTETTATILETAARMGAAAGADAAAWFAQDAFGGRVTRGAAESARRVLAGIEDGDPAILDSLPALDLSGQWADGPNGDSIVADVLGAHDLEIDSEDPADVELAGEILDAYRDAYDSAVSDEIARLAQDASGTVRAEIGTTGEYAAVDVTGSVEDAVSATIELEHPCRDDASCDIAAALEAGCPMSAAHLLTGATETPLLDAVVAHFGVDLHTPADWDAWTEYHRAHGRMCDSCGGCTYGDDSWTPDSCADCGATLPAILPDWAERLDVDGYTGIAGDLPMPNGAPRHRIDLAEHGRTADNRPRYAYVLRVDGAVIFEGTDLAGGVGARHDLGHALGQLLGFLSLRPGDTDSEYFDVYTPAQIDWRDAWAEDLGVIAYDVENPAA